MEKKITKIGRFSNENSTVIFLLFVCEWDTWVRVKVLTNTGVGLILKSCGFSNTDNY